MIGKMYLVSTKYRNCNSLAVSLTMRIRAVVAASLIVLAYRLLDTPVLASSNKKTNRNTNNFFWNKANNNSATTTTTNKSSVSDKERKPFFRWPTDINNNRTKDSTKQPDKLNNDSTNTTTTSTTPDNSSDNSTNLDTTTSDSTVITDQNKTESQEAPADIKNQQLSQPPTLTMMQQQPPVGGMVILMGPDHMKQQPQQPQPQQLPSSSAIILASIAGLISTSLRIWFLTSLTHWFSDNDFKSLVKPTQHFMWERLNDRYSKDKVALETAIHAAPLGMRERPWQRQMARHESKERKFMQQQQNVANKVPTLFEKTVVVVDIRAGPSGELDIVHLSEVITFLLSQHRQRAFGSVNGTSKPLEVVMTVESPGGAVTHFGLAAAQVGRLRREEGITSTLIADSVIASGGYMVACQADKLLAAPFAIVGSIGVIRESYSIHNMLQKFGIEPVSLKAGEDKAPLTLLSEVTKKDVEKTQQSLDKMHMSFKELVVAGRPMLAETFEDVCQGAIYLGEEAKALHLIDGVMTSEEYILERIQAGDRVLKLHRVPSFIKQRRHFLKDLNPLDFIRGQGFAWLRGQDLSQLVSKVLQTTTVLRFVQHLLRHREG